MPFKIMHHAVLGAAFAPGRLTAFRKGGSTLVVLPPGTLGKPMLWYTEVVGVPAGLVAQRRWRSPCAGPPGAGGRLVHVRDLSTVQKRRAGPPPRHASPARGDTGRSRWPIEVAATRDRRR
jgi:hypothetical protein